LVKIGQVRCPISIEIDICVLELFERRGAEVRVETLAVNRHRLEFAQVGAAGDVVVLVPFVSLQAAKFDALGAALKKIGVVGGVFGRYKNHVHIGPVRRLEVCQPKNQLAVFLLVDGGAP